ncbi:4872_t:CDS:10 [Funneliformis mosseae]|uniref:4872_t:CDS:1 n=1 Tax=Funneliformis mosseae TaxID=27381 RepID=A0A9N9C337_FUNMO|nr:4872_t:CDS:10 [Funneliformis mosseae]
MERRVQKYLSYFLDECSEYSVIGFFKHYDFAPSEKSDAHVALNKCLEYMCSSSDPELKSKASKIKKTLKDDKYKKDINAFWVSLSQEKKKQTLENRIKIVEKKSKLYDAEQHATMKKLVYEQDNCARENFRNAMIKPPPTPRSRKRKSENWPEHDKNFKMRLFENQSESEYEVDGSDESSDEDDMVDFDGISFDTFTETSKTEGDRWTLKSGEKLRDLLIRMTSKSIEQAKEIQMQSKGIKLDASILSIIRLGLSSIIDLSSEFSGGMYLWFGEEWLDLKEKVLALVNIKQKKFEGVVNGDIDKLEKLCNEYKYWEARDFIHEKLKGRPNGTTLQRQIMKIYFFIMDMFLENPYIFVNKEGKKQDLTEIEFALKVFGPILDIIFSDVQHLVKLKWGETVSKATSAGRKIDLQIKCQEGDMELSHSECARSTTRVKLIKDRSKCLRTNKCVLDQFLKHNLSEDMVENSAIFGLQFADLYGQVIGIDLLDEGLYFGFEGPSFRFPTQLNDIAILRQALEVLYYFKDNIVRKAEALSRLNISNPIYKNFHTEIVSRPHHRKCNFIRPTYFTPKGQLKNEMSICSREETFSQ